MSQNTANTSPMQHQAAPFSNAVQQIRLAREKIVAQPSGAPDLEYKLLLMFVKNELLASLAIPVLAIVVTVALMSWVEADQLLLWLAIVFISKGVLLLLCRRFEMTPRAQIDVALWRRHLAAAEFFYAMTWAAVAFVGIDSGNTAALFFLFALLMVVVAIRMIFALTVLPIIYAGTIPLTAALVIRFMMTGEPFFWALGVVAIGIHVCLIFLVKSLNHTVLSMLGYRAEKDALIAEFEQAKAVAEEAARRAQEASAAKSKFLATMSHELRTPLNAILGFSEVMKGEMLGPIENDAYKAYAGDIHDSGQHLLKLINEILDISRIEAGRYELQEQPVNLTAAMQDCHRLLRLRADSKGIKVTENYARNMPRLWADERSVRQICLNLLSNAIKFTPTGGTIALTIGMKDTGEQFVSVRDNGPGIPQDELSLVMTSFGQGQLAQLVNEGGTGLGLPIVKGLAELHGGTFHLHSAEKQGTEALVTFAKARTMQPHAHTPVQDLLPEDLMPSDVLQTPAYVIARKEPMIARSALKGVSEAVVH